MFDQSYLLIPAYQPNKTLLLLVDQLLEAGFKNIVVVDDGSDKTCQSTFDALPDVIHVLKHSVNQGKGAALKTGFKYIQQKNSSASIVTIDADGQHEINDVLQVCKALDKNPKAFVLGVRQFDKSVPWRSRFGNTLTRKVFSFLYNMDLQDTQTGLRGIPSHLINGFLSILSDRYEFESECLVFANEQGCAIVQVPIKTIYIDENQSSHFNPVLDSLKIYFVFFRYCLVALFSFCIDFIIFATLHFFTSTIFLSLLCSRIISGAFNFYQNKFRVYRCSDKALLFKQAFEYALLAIVIFIASYVLIKMLTHHFGINVLWAKVIVDGFLFTLNFFVQKVLIFRRGAS